MLTEEEFMKTFEERFGERLRKLLVALKKADVITEEDSVKHSNPRSLLEVHEAMQLLDTAIGKL